MVGDVMDPVKSYPSPSVIIAKIWLVCMSYHVCVCWVAQKLGEMGPSTLGARLISQKLAFPRVRYHAEFGFSRSNGTGVHGGHKMGTLGPSP